MEWAVRNAQSEAVEWACRRPIWHAACNIGHHQRGFAMKYEDGEDTVSHARRKGKTLAACSAAAEAAALDRGAIVSGLESVLVPFEHDDRNA